MAANINQPAFQPVAGGTVNLSVTASSSNVAVQAANANRHVRIVNAGTKTAFVRFGEDNTVAAAATTDMPILAGTSFIVAAPHPYAAAICGGSDTTTLYFTPGEGVS